MSYQGSEAGRVEIEPSISGSHDFWTFEAVEERLVEAMLLWRRSPGGGRWPFAGDGPWALITRRVRMAEGIPSALKPSEQHELVQAFLREDDEAETRQWHGRDRRGALTRDEVARRDEASEWLRLVPEADRDLVVLALGFLASGQKRVPWMRLRRPLGVKFGADGLRKRYHRALAGVAERLNAADFRDGGAVNP